LLREIPFGEDGDFSSDSLIRRFNSDLANDLGNLLNRTLTMIEKYFGGQLPEADKGSRAEVETLKKKTLSASQQVLKEMDILNFNLALTTIWELINTANKFIEDIKPWVLVKGDPSALKKVIYALYEVLRFTSILIWPFMPSTSDKIRQQMGLEEEVKEGFINRLVWGLSKPKIKISKDKPLFPRIKM
jgi:methionyl-tRNA synthetase